MVKWNARHKDTSGSSRSFLVQQIFVVLQLRTTPMDDDQVRASEPPNFESE